MNETYLMVTVAVENNEPGRTVGWGERSAVDGLGYWLARRRQVQDASKVPGRSRGGQHMSAAGPGRLVFSRGATQSDLGMGSRCESLPSGWFRLE